MKIRGKIEEIIAQVIAKYKSGEYESVEEDNKKPVHDEIDLTKSYFGKGNNYSSKEHPKENLQIIKEEKPEEILVSDGDPKEVKPFTGRSSIRERQKINSPEKEKILQNAFLMINANSYELGPLLVPFKPKTENILIPIDL